MKRTRSINLDRMRKQAPAITIKPFAIAFAVTTLAGCGSNTHEGAIFKDVAQCTQQNPTQSAACEQAYNEAVKKAASTAPKYATEADCVSEFGDRSCVPYRTSTGQSWFMPALGGFLFAQAIRGNRGYVGTPLFTSYSRGSSMYGSWNYADGVRHGPSTFGRTTYRESALQPKPAVTRTIARGGFGSTVAAKAASARSRSSSSRSWGG